MNRLTYGEKFFDEISRNLDEPSYHIYFYGCPGIGKSFLVYQLACRLMNQPDNVVVYAPECSFDIVFSTLKTLYVVCKSYDLPSIDQVLDDKKLNFKTIIKNQLDARLNDVVFVVDMINRVEAALMAENKRLIFVIDQTDLIVSESNIFAKQIEFLNKLLQKHKVIESGSPDNEVILVSCLQSPIARFRFSRTI